MLKAYMYTHRRGILAFFLMMIAAACIIRLYELPPEAVGYTAAVSGFIGAVFLLEDFMRFRKRTCALETLHREATVSLDSLPEPQNDLEAQYQELLRMEFAEKERLSGEQQDCYRDMMEYYSMWAHQIKTPISAMRLTLHGEGGAQARRLSAQLTRIEQYVDMVLAYQRLESASTDYVFAPIALDDAVRASVRRFAGEFIDRGLKLDFRPGGAQVLTDAKWLGFMLDQLISNALKYTPSGGVTIEMEGETTLAIRDSGIGISPQDLPRIFERGYTGRNGRADQRASGIGLYLCRRILTRLGHDISIQSAPGRGTRVTIRLDSAEIGME